jgi:hypothetical protein
VVGPSARDLASGSEHYPATSQQSVSCRRPRLFAARQTGDAAAATDYPPVTPRPDRARRPGVARNLCALSKGLFTGRRACRIIWPADLDRPLPRVSEAPDLSTRRSSGRRPGPPGWCDLTCHSFVLACCKHDAVMQRPGRRSPRYAPIRSTVVRKATGSRLAPISRRSPTWPHASPRRSGRRSDGESRGRSRYCAGPAWRFLASAQRA